MLEDADRSPVFVVGAPRSGTTLVYSLLLASDDFAIYEEGETRLLECRSRYGPLRFGACYRRFMKDWIRSDQFKRSGLAPEPFLRGASLHRSSYVDLLRFFMSEMCRSQGKRRWAEKTPANIYHMERLAREFPSSRFVHVIRDGRDVALSRRKLGWRVTWAADPEEEFLGQVEHWERVVRLGQASGARLGSRYSEVRYESLVQCPEREIARLAGFVEAPIQSGSGGLVPVGALKKGFSAFQPRLSGISSSPVERWRSLLTPRESMLAGVAVGEILERLGYTVDDVDVSRLSRWLVRGRASMYADWLFFRRWLRERTLLGVLKRPRLLDFGGAPLS